MTGQAAASIRGFAARAGAATPAHRDRAVDALRALAIAGVILGHWLVTALVPGPRGGALRDESPLAAMPALAPLSWVFQTLAIFFFVGGYAAARGFRGRYLPWLRRRLARLTRPVAMLAAVWAPLAVALWLAGVPAATLRTVLTLVADPLWFIGVYAILTAATPPAVALVRRLGAAAAVPCAAVVAGADAVRFGLGGTAWVGWINVIAAWMVPYLLGIAFATGGLSAGRPPGRYSGGVLGGRPPGRYSGVGRRTAALMLAGGAAATAALIGLAGYPASMVGVNGAAVSNLNPPTLAAVTFGIAQVGLALLLYGPLSRLMRRPLAWAAVAAANLSAMTLFLWHQSAFLAVTAAGLAAGGLPGLATAPASPLWIAERLGWLPAFCAALAACWLLFRRAEWAGSRRRRHSGNNCSAESGISGRPRAAGGAAQAPRPGRAHDATMIAATATGSGFVNWHAAIRGTGAGGPLGGP